MKINVTKSSIPPFEEYCEEIKDIWLDHWLTNTGPKYNKLKELVTKYLDVENVSLYTNGHLALEAAIALFGFPHGSEIITTPFTFVSTTNAIVRCGCTPVFCDICESDYTIDCTKIEKLITNKTVAILPVHVYGNACNVAEIDRIAKKHNLKVIYDAAHAFGVKIKGNGIGNFGDVSMFSFHATKVFNTIEGGCVCFNKKEYNSVFEDMKNFGIRDEEHCLYIGGNAKMNEFQAAMGICNLRNINENISKRKEIVSLYRKRLNGVKGIILCGNQKDVESNYSYMPVIFHNYKYDRNQIKEMLSKKGIGARKYFYPLTSSFKAYSGKFPINKTPNAEEAANNVLTLPLYADLSLEEVDYICDIILSISK